jgi:lipid II isoglutaminyl synthase (glutamine-hydrolysing)
MEIKICHLYPDLLNLYGDRGNILSLMKRCAWRGIDVSLENISIGDRFDPEFFDIIFLGGGQDFEQEILSNDILNDKASEILNAVENDKTFLCICGGYQMLGSYYVNQQGKEIRFLGAIDIYTLTGSKRMIGNTLYSSNLLQNSQIVGFENHSGRTYLGSRVKPLAKVVKGFGNNGEDGTEGAVYKNVFCSYSHGPLLPKNPALADHIIQTTLKTKYGSTVSLDPLDDSIEILARNSVIKALMSRSKT